MTQIIRGCTLEVDNERGVIYVHGPKRAGGRTLLRVCRLPAPIPKLRLPDPSSTLDITHLHGADWRADQLRGGEIVRAMRRDRELQTQWDIDNLADSED